MQRPEATAGTIFSQPIRAITTMLVVLMLIGAGGWLIHNQIADILWTNPFLNGIILLVFFLGLVTCFWQVLTLVKSVNWIETYASGGASIDEIPAPRLLAPLAALLRSRGSHRVAISSTSGRSILDSVAQRLDEARDITRYLVNLLVFLGLLGTFWGLATTVPAVVETIRALRPAEGESGMDVFAKLMGGLESQLGGMGTAFSSSLLGLGGSLVVGLLELFAGNGQNRFYRELEEWVSSITRIGLGDGEGGDQTAIVQILDHMAGQMGALQSVIAASDAARSGIEARLDGLSAALDRLGDRFADSEQDGAARLGHQLAIFERMTATQDRLVEVLNPETGGSEAESRMRLRSIDVQLLRILEEMTAGRQETVTDLRNDIAALTQAIRQMSRMPPAGRG